jgi:putative oxidoreductase
MHEWASLPLRIGVGVMFAAHGAQKLFGSFGGPGVQGFAGMLKGMGFEPALFWAYVAGGVEFFGGLFLLAGFLTRISAASLALLIAVAGFKVHLSKGFFLSQGGYEYTLIIFSACCALVLNGPGRFAVTKKL